MAEFCVKCGTPLVEGVRFCTGCGAPIGAPSVQAAPPPESFAETPLTVPSVIEAGNVPPASVPATPVYAAPVPAAPAPKSSSPVLKIVLAVVALLIFFSLLGAGACIYGIYRMKQKATEFQKQVQSSFPVPTGTLEERMGRTNPMSSPDAASTAPIKTGVPVYPGAVAKEGGGQMNLGVAGMKIQQYVTSDSVDQVAAFYKDKLGSKATMTMNGNSALVQIAGSNGIINVSISPGDSDGKTLISITSITR